MKYDKPIVLLKLEAAQSAANLSNLLYSKADTASLAEKAALLAEQALDELLCIEPTTIVAMQDVQPEEPAATKPKKASRKKAAAPVETAPVETAPVETAPVETAPAETAPAETAPAETAPAETAPAEVQQAVKASEETPPTEEDTPPFDVDKVSETKPLNYETDVKPVLIKAATKDQPAVVQLLASYGAKNGQQLKQEDLAGFLEHVNAILMG